jgi:hypothetical protein
MTNQNELKKAFTTLDALKQNIPNDDDYVLDEKYANMFNKELDRLINLGFDVNEFKIPEQDIKQIELSRHRSGKIDYTDEKYVDKKLFLIKLDSILAYFSIMDPENKIGFELN